MSNKLMRKDGENNKICSILPISVLNFSPTTKRVIGNKKGDLMGVV